MCYDKHYHPCPMCGKEALTTDLQHLNSCCSSSCSRKKATQSIADKFDVHPSSTPQAKERRKQTNIAKYGSENVMGCEAIRTKSRERTLEAFRTKGEDIQSKKVATCLEVYGTAHPMQSDLVKAKVIQTNQYRYGCDNVAQSPEVQDKMKATMLDRHGVENAFQSKEVQDRIKATNLEKFGTEYAIQSKVVKDKAIETMLERHGVIHPRQNSEINRKGIETFKAHMEDINFAKARNERHKGTMNELYEGNGFASPSLSKRARATMQEKYQVDYFPQSHEWKEKYEATSLVRYGESNPMKSQAIKQKVSDSLSASKNVPWPAYLNMKNSDKLSELLKFKENPREYVLSLKDDLRTEPAIAEMVGVSPSAISAYVISHNLYDIVHVSKSGMEDCICEFLDSLNVAYVRNTRQVISPLELDIYLPEHRIAIECNPTITHNSSFCDPWGGEPKHYKYHQDKSIQCRNKDVFLFHIFGYEWTNRTDVVKSMLMNLVNANTYKVYARQTYVKQLDASECLSFLNNNHRQGATNASIRLGLLTKNTNELVSVMTFNRVRKTIGMNSDSDNIIELSRFCNKLNTSVVGGASKLFKFFVDNFSCEKIVSFSDIAHTRGNLYNTLGFQAVSESSPGYVWVNTSDDSFYNRVSCQKGNLRNLFKDDSIDIDNRTEKEIMMEHGYAQVFDSGVIRWEYTCCNLT